MSRDIFVQDIPVEATSPTAIPDDFVPRPLPFSAKRVRSVIATIWPSATFALNGWIAITGADIDIDAHVEDADPLMGFAFFDRSADGHAANLVISAVLSELGVRAFDMNAPDGMFTPVSE